MLTRNLFILLLFHLFNLSIHAAEIGTWNAYMAYHDVTEIEKAGNILYVLASNNVYAYNII